MSCAGGTRTGPAARDGGSVRRHGTGALVRPVVFLLPGGADFRPRPAPRRPAGGRGARGCAWWATTAGGNGSSRAGPRTRCTAPEARYGTVRRSTPPRFRAVGERTAWSTGRGGPLRPDGPRRGHRHHALPRPPCPLHGALRVPRTSGHVRLALRCPRHPEDALARFGERIGVLAPRSFCLLHGDPHRENLIVDGAGRLWVSQVVTDVFHLSTKSRQGRRVHVSPTYPPDQNTMRPPVPGYCSASSVPRPIPGSPLQLP